MLKQDFKLSKVKEEIAYNVIHTVRYMDRVNLDLGCSPFYNFCLGSRHLQLVAL